MTEGNPEKIPCLPAALAALYALLCASAFVYLALYLRPIVFFPYDLHGLDGDMLNYSRRLAEGLPIYFDDTGGGLLSIYPPLYFLLAAPFSLLGGFGIPAMRLLAVAFFAGVAGVIFLAVRRGGGAPAATLAALAAAFSLLFFMDPPFSGSGPVQPFSRILIKTTPENCSTFFGMCCLLFASQRGGGRRTLLFSALFGVGACLAKQGGVFAPLAALAYLAAIRKDRPAAVFFASVSAAAGLAAAAATELAAPGFLYSVLFSLPGQMQSSMGLAAGRTLGFLVFNSVWFALGAAFRGYSGVTVWHLGAVSGLLVGGLTSSNFSAGMGYFLPSWACLLAAAWSGCAPALREMAGSGRKLAASGIMSLMLLHALAASFNGFAYLEAARPDLKRAAETMSAYYRMAERVLAGLDNRKVFTSRVSGAFVEAGADIEYEFTTVRFGWKKERSTVKERLLARVREGYFGVVAVNFPLPGELDAAVSEAYRLCEALPVNHYMGLSVEKARIMVPKGSRSPGCPPQSPERFQRPKKSLPLSSTSMKAGKPSTSMAQTASMPSSG